MRHYTLNKGKVLSKSEFRDKMLKDQAFFKKQKEKKERKKEAMIGDYVSKAVQRSMSRANSK